MSNIYSFVVYALYLLFLVDLVRCGNFNSKFDDLPRSPRNSNSKTNNEEFEKFFLKASKSVPRIGRRGSLNERLYTDSATNGLNVPIKTLYSSQFKKPSNNKNYETPFWSDIAEIYEYNPELPNILQYMSNLEQEQGDDPLVYNLDKLKMKKKNFGSQNKEAFEYRIQPEV